MHDFARGIIFEGVNEPDRKSRTWTRATLKGLTYRGEGNARAQKDPIRKNYAST